MVPRPLRALLGVVVVALGLSLVVASWGIPVTVCFGPTDSLTCSTDTVAQVTSLLCLATGVGGVVAGGRELWKGFRGLRTAR